MKTFTDRLREMPLDKLRQLIEREKQNLLIAQRDIETMEQVLKERLKA